MSSFLFVERVTGMVKQSIRNEMKRMNEQLKPHDKGMLIIEQNKDGTFGQEKMTREQLDAYLTKNHYSGIITDDII